MIRFWRQAPLPLLLLILGYGFWVSPDFKEIAAGVALFLFGMLSLEKGFKAFTGGTLEQVLRASTNRLWKSIAFGITSTTLMQSSTLVSLVTISFVSAEMITLAAGIGVIMGANLGTTTGAWLIAGLGLRVDIAGYAMPALVVGVILLLQRSKVLQGIGYLALGVGFLFLGIHYMKEGFEAFQGAFDLSGYVIPGILGVLLYTGIGMLITVIMQSSHATLLVIITALATGQISYDSALALAIGANLGSAITTAIGGMTANLGGKRLAIAHVLFNVMTATVAIVFIGQMAWAVDHLGALIGLADDEYLLKLALFHTLFNLLGVILLAPFTGVLERALIKYVNPAPKSREKPLYLYPGALETPATAISALRKEVGHLYDNAHDLIAHGVSLRRSVIDSDQSLADAVKNTRRIIPLDVDDVYEAKIKSLHSDIIAFISEIQGRELSQQSVEQLYDLQQASRDIVEAVKATKHLQKNLSRHGLSANPLIRERYDVIRLQIARVLREIRQLRTQDPETVTRLSLDAIKLSVQKSGRSFTADLNELIRGRRLSSSIATSMMNDENYAFEICSNLIEASHALLLPPTRAEQSAEGQLALNEQDIARMAGGNSNPRTRTHTDENEKTAG
ncbi:Na/Pi cotransporter family protein [Ectothiorhodospira shaposhnikovii]|uniref:Na/Pi cotransporter family protein n=1 Tax=Ectothiorhodospira shaposhnikovii TaxID=1054 RepID=UPI001EE9A14F|nr:Na/Pi symporter [Ectothiorhodospira shaposhnikovii]MCG5512680.1 Na/Pi symporter [Ectothiorhodospira shaposhnikovii]